MLVRHTIRHVFAPRKTQTPFYQEVNALKRITLVRILLYLTFFLAMIASGWSLGTPTRTRAELGTCCSTSEDCTREKLTPVCCIPGAYEADCSQNKHNYCRGTVAGGCS